MIAAVIPMKPLAEAKSRLGPLLPDAAREALATQMLANVIAACHEAPEITGTHVVTADDRVMALARRHGAAVLAEAAPAGLNAAVSCAADALLAEGTPAMLVLPGDLPLLTAIDIAHLAGTRRDRRSVTIAASDDRDGTNALLLSPPDAIAPAFGPGSFGRHLAAARQAGIASQQVATSGLGLDVDGPEDLVRLRGHADPRYSFLLAQAGWEISPPEAQAEASGHG